MAIQPVGVFCADNHLAERTWIGPGREIAGDSYSSFRQIIDFCVNNHLPLVAAGDIIDKAVNRSSPIAFAFQQLDRLAHHDLPFYYLQGNHDEATPPWFSGHHGAVHVNTKMFHLGRVQLYGLDYHPDSLLQIALAAIPAATDVLVAHQCWADMCGTILTPQGSFGDIPVVSNVFTGDLHKFAKITTRGSNGQLLTAVSPGSTQLCAINEPEDHFFCVLYSDLSWKRVKLQTRRRLTYQLTADGDVDAVVQQLPAALDKAAETAASFDTTIQKPLLWITAVADLPQAKERVEAAAAGRAHMFWKELPTAPTVQVLARRQIAETTGQRRAATLSSELHDYLVSQDLEHLERDARRLLEATDPAAELRRLREETLNAVPA